VMDLIGAARPSIDEGRVEDIRECIGCNICSTGHRRGVPLRCTQNPTIGEEWRHGWHPERIPEHASERTVLVIGAGPAGLEAARARSTRLRSDACGGAHRAGWAGRPRVRTPEPVGIGARARLAGRAARQSPEHRDRADRRLQRARHHRFGGPFRTPLRACNGFESGRRFPARTPDGTRVVHFRRSRTLDHPGRECAVGV
jgi:hypothetical protein